MKESKIHATERLRREGRWNEASAFRDEVRSKLRAEGKLKTEANEAAWSAMIEKFPPPPVSAEADGPEVEPSSNEEADPDHLDFPADAASPDLIRDAVWVYGNLENKRAAVTDAPSLGAWSMLKWARENRDRFFEHLFPKVIAARQKQPDASEWQAEEEISLTEIERMLAEVSGSSATAPTA